MTHCYFHPAAKLEPIPQDVRFSAIDGDKLEHRTVLRCSAMLSDNLRCPFVCVAYDEDRVDERKCGGCGGKMESCSDNESAMLTRCATCRRRMQKAYRMRNAKKSGRALLAQVHR